MGDEVLVSLSQSILFDRTRRKIGGNDRTSGLHLGAIWELLMRDSDLQSEASKIDVQLTYRVSIHRKSRALYRYPFIAAIAIDAPSIRQLGVINN